MTSAAEKRRESKRQWSEANREKQREANRRWYEANPEKARAKSRRWEAANRERRRAHVLLWRYSISVATYNRLLAAQAGVCAVCGDPPETLRLAVDHDHACCPGQRSCGRCIRGLLCSKCNAAAERAERPGWTDAISSYLTDPPASHLLDADDGQLDLAVFHQVD